MKDRQPKTTIVETNAKPDGSATLLLKVPGAANFTVLKDNANVFAAESPAAVKALEELAKKNGTTVDEERKKLYEDLVNW